MTNYYHLWTPENQQIILTCENDFKMAMNILGLCAALFPGIVILTFELMDNHLHVTLRGKEEEVRAFFEAYKRYLRKWLNAIDRHVDLSGFICQIRKLETHTEIRNVISYVNRNGFLVNPDETPYSYRWGAGRFFFNPDAKMRYDNEGRKIPMVQRRSILHSHAGDRIEHIYMLDGYACPLSFCRIDYAERYYKNAAHYFYEISKNIESQREIAMEIGESIRYSDGELYRIAVSLSKEKYNQKSPSLLSQTDKTEFALYLHYDYGASKKQLCRILKMPIATLDTLFASPEKKSGNQGAY